VSKGGDRPAARLLGELALGRLRRRPERCVQRGRALSEGLLLERLFCNREVLNAQVADVMGRRSDRRAGGGDYKLLSKGRSTAVLVTDHGRAVGVMTRSDILDHLATRARRG
jgi:CBS domain-containing protein